MTTTFLLQSQWQVTERGGNCVPVVCDSSSDEDLKYLFDQIQREQNGRLDILVNNAYAGVQVSDIVAGKTVNRLHGNKLLTGFEKTTPVD